jgi:putative membrane protein
MQAELAGATAGFAATIPMTAAMEVMHRMLPHEERYPLPPRQIVDNATRQAGAEHAVPGRSHDSSERHSGLHADREDRAGVALAAHFAFGAMAGSAYGPIARTRPSRPALAGVGYGLLVWGSQYLGVLPAAGVLSNATDHPIRRNALMIASHVVWGAALGVIADRLTRRSRR